MFEEHSRKWVRLVMALHCGLSGLECFRSWKVIFEEQNRNRGFALEIKWT